MYIALCDDDASIYDETKAYITRSLSGRQETVHFDTYSTAEEFLASPRHYDILFMDVYMGEISGVEAVSRMERPRADCVVFMTTSREHAVDAFRLGAQHYLVKPLCEQDVRAAMERCLTVLSAAKLETLSFVSSSGTVILPYHRIIYLEAINKRVEVHTDSEAYITYTSLDDLYKKLSANVFMRAQRSYIVNMRHITNFFADHIVLEDSFEITLSRRNQEALKKQYQDYLFRLVRRPQ